MLKFSLLLIASLLFQTNPCLATEEQPMQNTKNPIVVFTTTEGDIKIQLDAEKAPESTKNFLHYATTGFYDGTIFHRVINNFMIQGGGFTADMEQKPTEKPIKNEAANGLKNVRGSVAMARTSDINSATAQFFINVNDNDFLNHKSSNPQEFGYAVVGKVVGGMDVVDKIKGVKTGTKSAHRDVPVEPVKILSTKVEQ